MNIPVSSMHAAPPLRHGQSERWLKVCQSALAKMLSELTYEEVLAPEPSGDGQYELTLESEVTYRFRAQVMAWGNLYIDAASIRRLPCQADGVSPLQFSIDAQTELGMQPETLATFLRELSNTLRQDLVLAESGEELTADALLALPPHSLHALLEGHPKACANKGRLGWGASDVMQYAPEGQQPFEPLWLGASRDRSVISTAHLDEEAAFLRGTLGEEAFVRLCARLSEQGGAWETHTLIPVHPWQWDNMLQQTHVMDLMQDALIPLGPSGGRYVAGPSLRTLTSLDRRGSPDLKLALTILNTSAWRGIPGKYIPHGPALSDWLGGVVESDALLKNTVTILKERFGIWYRHRLYEQIPDTPYQHHESLGAIWRDCAQAGLKTTQKAYLYAALLHPDSHGVPLAAAHARKSGLALTEWLDRLFTATVVPLYHLLCTYGIGFIAHGQNVTVILDNHIPVGVALKDLQGDVDLVNMDLPEQGALPDAVRDVLGKKPPAHLIHHIQTGHFVTVLRFLSARLAVSGQMEERQFYTILRDSLLRYMEAYPQLQDRFDMFDLLKPTVPRVCINKVRFEIGYGDSANRPLPDLGSDLINPLYRSEN